MERILDFSQPMDVSLLDQVINCLVMGSTQDRQNADKVLVQFKDHHESWTRVDTILEYSQNMNSKFFALQILENTILFRWHSLPKDQQTGIKNYIVNLIIKLSSDAQTMKTNKLILLKLNQVLVAIIKQEWPKNWENFIPEIVGSSKTNESLCENNMNILRLISEEVFDFSSGQLTSRKASELKESFNKEFSLVYELCELVLLNSENVSLLQATLSTLLKFLNWIPLGYIFETKMISTLLLKFLPTEQFRIGALECLTEIAALNIATHEDALEQIFVGTVNQLRVMLDPECDIASAYENGTDEQVNFIHRITMFLTTFFRTHLRLAEKPEYAEAHLAGHSYLCGISLVEDTEIFKICLEYWGKLSSDLYHEPSFNNSSVLMGFNNNQGSSRRQLYGQILSRVRLAMIKKMPKPEEVLIVEDENNEIVRETMKDTDSIILYKSMRQTLIFLTHLDPEDTQNIMLTKLSAQVHGGEFTWQNLNTLCWAIGAISGAQNEEYEKRFLVTVIKDLLGLCEMKRGKDNKAVIASNIMYIVGQYPRFLRAHWKFLKTVVNKLFEFMHETHPGVQDMAVETFLTIAQKCKRKFVVVQHSENFPFVEDIINNLSNTIRLLENAQIHVFYEAVGHMIAAHNDNSTREHWVTGLMNLPNQMWARIMTGAVQNIDYLKQNETARDIVNVLKTNQRACMSLGPYFVSQMGKIYLDMLNIYKAYSEMISNTIQQSGAQATFTASIRGMRQVKRNTLKLIEIFIERSEDNNLIVQNFIPPLLSTVLDDYRSNIADARDPEVLSVMAVIFNKLQSDITEEAPRIFESVFECTLGMITQNFQDHPEHRLHFFTLLRAVNQYCFPAFFQLPPQHFKLVIDSIVWAFKHTERNISNTGLNVLYELLQNVHNGGKELYEPFYKQSFLALLQDLFFVLTDTFHKAGFKMHATILMHLFSLVESGSIQTPLWTDNENYPNNQVFVRQFVAKLLVQSFQNLTQTQVEKFVTELFQIRDLQMFKGHLRDFLVQLKEFAGDTEDLFLEEKEAERRVEEEKERQRAMTIPGFIPPVEMEMNIDENNQEL